MEVRTSVQELGSPIVNPFVQDVVDRAVAAGCIDEVPFDKNGSLVLRGPFFDTLQPDFSGLQKNEQPLDSDTLRVWGSLIEMAAAEMSGDRQAAREAEETLAHTIAVVHPIRR